MSPRVEGPPVASARARHRAERCGAARRAPSTLSLWRARPDPAAWSPPIGVLTTRTAVIPLRALSAAFCQSQARRKVVGGRNLRTLEDLLWT
ncbi:hypothetical protein PGT21_000174 [Puccinia graminis f. sp. tritici]|uniref:Uncharacterized protein n=1 Tax=Puccinia graminis f. sp. tritici TaxID=56615 RepID=A0A5B0MXK5_PUCGR|nr:hypothetical protein PGT21_000174 [Puccinia graminis f. sp. tritici]